MSVLIKGGRIVTAADDYVGDIYIDNGTVSLADEASGGPLLKPLPDWSPLRSAGVLFLFSETSPPQGNLRRAPSSSKPRPHCDFTTAFGRAFRSFQRHAEGGPPKARGIILSPLVPAARSRY